MFTHTKNDDFLSSQKKVGPASIFEKNIYSVFVYKIKNKIKRTSAIKRENAIIPGSRGLG